MNALAVALAVACSVGANEQKKPSLRVLVDAHTSALGLIHSIDLKLVFYHDRDGSVKATEPVQTWRWSKQVDRERIRARWRMEPWPDGLTRNSDDVFLDGAEARVLHNWDPNNPQPIEPANQGTVKATIEPRTRLVPGQKNPPRVLLFSFQLLPMDERRTLAELVKESPGAKVVGEQEVGGRKAWQLRVEHPGVQGENAGSYLDVFLDPSANYLARKAAMHVANVRNAQGAMSSADVVIEVAKFKDFGNGVLVPLEILQYTKGKDSPAENFYRVFVEDLTVNEPLAPDALDFRFPENAMVQLLPAKNNRVAVLLWGADNQPVRKFDDTRQLLEFIGAAGPGPSDAPSVETRPALVFMILGLGIPAFLLALAWGLRRWRMKHRG